MTMPRMTGLLMLRLTMKTGSASASRSFRGLLPHPTQQLCTLRVRRRRRLTQHSLPGRLVGDLDRTCNGGSRQLTGAFLHPLASASAFLEQRFPDRCVDHGPCSAPLELTCPVSLQPVRASCLHLFGRLCHACAASARGWVNVR